MSDLTNRNSAANQIEQLKRDAKRLKKAKGITHVEALDEIAREKGFSEWSRLMQAFNATGAA